MPSYRNRRRRRRRTKKTTKQVYKNKKDLKVLKKLIEPKFLDGTSTMSQITTASSHVLLLNDIDQSAGGEDIQTRIGRDILARRIFVRGYMQNTNGTPADGIMRILLVRYKDSKGEQIATNKVLYNEQGATTVNGFLNVDEARHFDVILDTTFGYDTSAHTLIPFKYKKKLNHVVRYNSSTGTYDMIEKNSLWLIAITTQATAANAPDLVLEWRYSYLDN